jgi:hypothetical protein
VVFDDKMTPPSAVRPSASMPNPVDTLSDLTYPPHRNQINSIQFNSILRT